MITDNKECPTAGVSPTAGGPGRIGQSGLYLPRGLRRRKRILSASGQGGMYCAPYGFGLGLTPSGKAAVPLPGGQSLNLIASKGLTFGSGGAGNIGLWVDQISSYQFSFFGTGTNVSLGSINGNAAISFASASVSSYYSDTGIDCSALFSAAAYTIAVVAQYSGSTTGTGTTNAGPTVFGEVGGINYIGIQMVEDSTTPTKVRGILSHYPTNGISVIGGAGSTAQPHFIVAQFNGTTASVSMDGGSATSVGVSDLLTVGNSPTVGYNSGFGSPSDWQGLIGQVVCWPSGTVSVSAINAALSANWGIA
jgi:hypothetical protein